MNQAIKEHQNLCKKVIEISNMTDDEMEAAFEKEYERQEALNIMINNNTLLDITDAVTAVFDVFSLESIDSLVDKIEVPALLISTITSDPDDAVVNDDLTLCNVPAYGILNVTFAEPVVMLLFSSETAITK